MSGPYKATAPGEGGRLRGGAAREQLLQCNLHIWQVIFVFCTGELQDPGQRLWPWPAKLALSQQQLGVSLLTPCDFLWKQPSFRKGVESCYQRAIIHLIDFRSFLLVDKPGLSPAGSAGAALHGKQTLCNLAAVSTKLEKWLWLIM